MPNLLEPGKLGGDERVMIGLGGRERWPALKIHAGCVHINDIRFEVDNPFWVKYGLFVILVVFGLVKGTPETLGQKEEFGKLDHFVDSRATQNGYAQILAGIVLQLPPQLALAPQQFLN